MRRRVPILLCALLFAALLVGVAPVSAQPDAEETRLEAQLQDDGDARWSIVVVIDLDNEQDREDFESFGDAFESGDRDFELGVGAFERAAEEASTATGRSMSIEEPQRGAALINETVDGNETVYGELRISFTWESFARLDENGTMYVGDAFNTTEGTWLPGLEEDQRLVIRSPPGYGGPTTSPIGAQDGDLFWMGPRTFEPGYFEIEYQPATTVPSETGLSTMLLVGALVLSVMALLLGLYLLVRRSRDGETPGGATASDAAADDGEVDGTSSATEPAGETVNGGAESPDSIPDDSADDAPDLDLLSDEERVEYLLEENGGRMKQADIVKETGWSNAKVSQLLSAMADEDRIDKLRIGRENLISLPDEGIGEIDNDDQEA